MQYEFSALAHIYSALEATLSPERLGRYRPHGCDRNLGLRLYWWNAALAKEFLLPIHFSEVCVRNKLNDALVAKYGPQWFDNKSFTSHLKAHLSNELDSALRKQKKQHGTAFSVNHVVSGLSSGFWVDLTSENARHLLWGGSLPPLFAYKPMQMADSDIYEKLNRLRMFRNRVAHHEAIFDKWPMAEYRNICDIVGWICPQKLKVMQQMANPAAIINAPPQSMHPLMARSA